MLNKVERGVGRGKKCGRKSGGKEEANKVRQDKNTASFNSREGVPEGGGGVTILSWLKVPKCEILNRSYFQNY